MICSPVFNRFLLICRRLTIAELPNLQNVVNRGRHGGCVGAVVNCDKSALTEMHAGAPRSDAVYVRLHKLVNSRDTLQFG